MVICDYVLANWLANFWPTYLPTNLLKQIDQQLVKQFSQRFILSPEREKKNRWDDLYTEAMKQGPEEKHGNYLNFSFSRNRFGSHRVRSWAKLMPPASCARWALKIIVIYFPSTIFFSFFRVSLPLFRERAPRWKSEIKTATKYPNISRSNFGS